tara:strand:+ start:853 stop:1485 length:633 start_codon:yes stop_codon:yes gene_type:complete
MISNQTQGKGILAKVLEQGIRILLIKECRKISNIKINMISSSTQIIGGEIHYINIMAEDIDYKNLLFDKFELEASRLKVNFKLTNKALYFKNNPIIKFKISLSEISLTTILLSSKWNWIRNMISETILNKDRLEEIKIKDSQFIIKTSKKDNIIYDIEKIDIKIERGKIYLENKNHNKILQIPIEDKIYIENVIIESNLINIFANSSISF